MVLFGVIEIKNVSLRKRVTDLVKNDEFVNAVKLYREETGKGIKQSKAYVDAIRFKMGKLMEYEKIKVTR